MVNLISRKQTRFRIAILQHIFLFLIIRYLINPLRTHLLEMSFFITFMTSLSEGRAVPYPMFVAAPFASEF